MIIENYILHLDQKEMLICNLKCLYSEALESLLIKCCYQQLPLHVSTKLKIAPDALNVYMYVMYLVFETFHMQELYPTTLYRLHSSELSRGARLCQRGANAPPHPPLNEALRVEDVRYIYIYK